ncbi:MAG TPA: TolC family protein [Caulobacteraceae bacterium]|nr:TolC family protein [Caulobacteraceae bacterium]
MRHPRRFIIAVWLAAPLLGCASYRPAPIAPAANAAAIDSRSLEDPRLLRFVAAAGSSAAPTATVRSAGATWDLSTLTLAALYFHPTLDIARSKLAEAHAAVVTAAAIPNPSLSLGELSYDASLATPSPWTVGPAIRFIVEAFGKRAARVAQARRLVEAAREDLATASWQVRGAVRASLIDLWSARETVALLRSRRGFQDQLVTLLQRRLAAGDASALEIARARIGLDQLGLALGEAERRRAQARGQLAASIGVPLAALDEVRLSFAAVEHPRPPDAAEVAMLRRRALVRRSDVQSRLADYAAAQSALKLQIAGQYPDIMLTAGYIFDRGQNKYLLSPAADLPIFNQGQGPIAEAMARRQEAAARFTALQSRVIGEVDAAAASYGAASRAAGAAEALAVAEDDRERRIERSFQAGGIDRPTLLAARIERSVAEQSRLAAVVQQRQALGALEDALQHPFFGQDVAASLLQTSPRPPTELTP